MVSDEAANFVLDRGRAIHADLQQAKAEIERLTAENERLSGIIKAQRQFIETLRPDQQRPQQVTGYGFDPDTGREFPCDKDGNEVQ